MNPDIVRDKDKYNNWDNPYYQAGYASGCETKPLRDRKLRDERDDLIKEVEKLKDEQQRLRLDLLKADTDAQYYGQEYTKLSNIWFIKLWNSIPRFSLSIRRTN